MVWGYWKQILCRALKEALADVGIKSRGGVMIGALIVLIYLGLVWYWLGADVAADELRLRVMAVAAVTSTLPLFFAWKLLKVPAEQHKGLSGSNAKLMSVLEHRRNNKVRALGLSILRERGHELMSNRITPAQYPMWAKDVKMWQWLTLKFLSHYYSHQEAVSFKALTFATSFNFAYRVSDEHNEKMQFLNARLSLLTDIVRTDQKDWSTISASERATIEKQLAVFQAESLAANGNELLD